MQATLKSMENDFEMLRLRLASKRQDTAGQYEGAFEQFELQEEPHNFALSPLSKDFLSELLALLNAPPLYVIALETQKLFKIIPLPALYIALIKPQGVKLIILTQNSVATLLRLILGQEQGKSQNITALEICLLEGFLRRTFKTTFEQIIVSADYNLVLGLNLPSRLTLHFNALLFCIEPETVTHTVIVAQKSFSPSLLKKGEKLHFGAVDLTQATLHAPNHPALLAQLHVMGEEVIITKV